MGSRGAFFSVKTTRSIHDNPCQEHGTALAVQRELRWSDSLRLMGVLLPLPCTVLLLEQILEPWNRYKAGRLLVLICKSEFQKTCRLYISTIKDNRHAAMI